MTPEELLKQCPEKPDDLIGKAKAVAKIFVAKAKSGDTTPLRLLFYGSPGIGKSAVCRIIAKTLAASHSIRHVSATQVTVEMVKEWMTDFSYMHEGWSVYWIEEADMVNPAVEVLLLQFMDQMPSKTAILLTSNAKMSGISDRFSSRTKAIRFEKPTQEEVAQFLLSRWSELGTVAQEIAEQNNGDVRASLNDVQLHFDAEKYKEQK